MYSISMEMATSGAEMAFDIFRCKQTQPQHCELKWLQKTNWKKMHLRISPIFHSNKYKLNIVGKQREILLKTNLWIQQTEQ